MRYIIYGAGAIGSGIGALLHQHGHDVVLIARGEHEKQIKINGLTVHTPDSTFNVKPHTVSHPKAIDWKDGDVVFLTMKLQDTESALEELLKYTNTKTPIISAQNGVEAERMIARKFLNVYGMVVMMSATFLDPGEVTLHSTPIRGWLNVGRYPYGLDSITKKVSSVISHSQMSSNENSQIMRLKYTKLKHNLNNALDALVGNSGRGGEVHKELNSEAEACFTAALIDIASEEEFDAIRPENFKIGKVPNHPRRGTSAWQSLARGKGIEVDYLNGEIVLLGTMHNIPTPYNKAVQELALRAVRDSLPPENSSEEEIHQLAAEYSLAFDKIIKT